MAELGVDDNKLYDWVYNPDTGKVEGTPTKSLDPNRGVNPETQPNYQPTPTNNTEPVEPVVGDVQKIFTKFIDQHAKVTKDKDFLTNLFDSIKNANNLGVKKPDMTPEITPVNAVVNAGMPPKEIAPRPFGVTLPNAPFATQDEADRDLLQQNIDQIRKEASARQLGDTQNITTNTLGTGLVKENVENVPGRASIFGATETLLNPVQKAIPMTLEDRIKLKQVGQEKVLADIPIYSYDPLDPSKYKQIGSFKGRQGMSPRMIPQSNVMTDTAQQVISSQAISMGNLENMKNIMATANIGDIGIYIAQAINNNTAFNLVVNGAHKTGLINDEQLDALLNFKAEFDAAKQNIAVARGGKQLTDTEIQLITNTLPRAFQNPALWDAIIERYKKEYNTFRTGLTTGKKSVEQIPSKDVETKTTTTGLSNVSAEGFSNFLKNKKK